MKEIALSRSPSSVSSQPAKWLVPVAMVVFLFLSSPAESRATVLSWSGGGGANANWNLSDNWGYSGIPANGDTLIFPASQPNVLNTNNIASLTLNQIRFVGPGGGYVIRGNAFTLTNNIEATNSAGANTIENNITLAATNQIVDVTTSLTLAGTLSGSVGVTKTGAGTLLYQASGNNPYTGTTRVNAGTLQLNVSGANAFGGPLVIGDGSGSGSPVVRLLQLIEIPDAPPITVNLNGLLDLNGFVDSIGNLTIQGGTVASGGGALTINGNLTTLASGTSATITGNLAFSGGLRTVTVADGGVFYDLNLLANVTDNGGGLLFTNYPAGGSWARLTGNNNLTGPLILNNLTLDGETSYSLGVTNPVTVGGNGTLWLFNSGYTNKSLTLQLGATVGAQNACTWTGPVTLSGDATLYLFTAPSTLNVLGQVTGAGGLTKTGPGTLQLFGSSGNTYAGNTFIQAGLCLLNKSSGVAIPSGTLTIGDNFGSSAVVRDVNVGANIGSSVVVRVNNQSLLDLNANIEGVGLLTLDGGNIQTGTGLLIMNDNLVCTNSTGTNQSSTISGNLVLGSSSRTFSVYNDLRISAAVSGTGGITKNGDLNLHLTASNSYAGLTLIQTGWLWAENSWALGGTANGTVVSNGASLVLKGGIAVTNESLVLNGSGVGAWGALDSQTQSGTFGADIWAGPITLNATSTIDTWNSDDLLRIIGPISGPGGLTQLGWGTLQLEGATANTYAGLTTVNSLAKLVLSKSVANGAIAGNLDVFGTLRLGANNQISEASDVNLESGSLFDLGVFYDRIDTLRGLGAVTFGVNGYIEVGANNGSSTYSGVMSGTGYTFGGYTVGKFGTGTFTMNGNHTFTTGAARVGSGKLVINGSQPQIPAIVDSGATLGGSGTVGTIEARGMVAPGNSAGILSSSNVTFFAAGQFNVELTGPNPGVGGYDQLNVRGTNTLANATLTVLPAFTTPVTVGQQFTILKNDGADAITGTFSGLAEGAGITVNGFSFKLSYVGGTGNDVVLTLTNLPLAQAGSAISLGNGSGTIDPDECNYLKVVITNTAGAPMTGISATLSSATPNVAVTQPFSAYADVPASGKGTNTSAFQISTAPNFVCGSTINLQLTVATISHGSFTVPVVLSSGSPSAVPLRYDLSVATNIPDTGTIESTNVVAGFTGPLEKVAVSLWLTHPIDSDLSISLISPDGTVVPLTMNLGAGANFGSSCSPDANRTTFDDTAATSITAGSPPFVGTFRPQGTLANFINTTPNGNWRLRITDGFNSSLGALRCWSLFLYPATCTAGGGLCELCPNVIITSATGPDALKQPNLLTYNGIPSTCGAPKACPGTDLGGPWPYNNYTIRNGPSDACVTVTVENDSTATAMLTTVYSGSYDPANPNKCINYLADGGNTIGSGGSSRTFSFNVASNAVFVVNIIASDTSLAPYKLTVSGGDCRPVLNITPIAANNIRLDWTTAAAGYGLEKTNTVVSGAAPWPPVPGDPAVVNGRFVVTNSAADGRQFYRLRKP